MRKLYSLAVTLILAMSVTAQTTKYVKVQTEPASWEGTYLIVYEYDDDNNIAYVFNGSLVDDALDSKGNFFQATNAYQIIDGNPSVRTIDATDAINAATFTVTKSTETEGKYNIQSKSGYWIGYNSTDPGEDGVNPDPNLKMSNEKTYDNDIAMQSGKTNVIVTAKNGFELRFNPDTDPARFRYHMSGKKKAIKFYRQELVDSAGNIVSAGISEVNDENSVKNEIFNLSGQRLSKPVRGLNIVNGKKVVVK